MLCFRQLGRQRPGIGERDDLIVLAVHHQHRDVDLLQILGVVGLREDLDAIVMGLGSAHHALAPPVVDDPLGNLGAGPIEAIERAHREHRDRTGRGSPCAARKPSNTSIGVPPGLLRRFHHDRRDGADHRGLGDAAAAAIPRDIADDFAAAGRMADMDGVLEIEMRDQSGAHRRRKCPCRCRCRSGSSGRGRGDHGR